jgi:uncharacterized protein YneF (UPF0154 family)
MLWFWLLIFGTALLTGSAMGWFFLQARHVPDDSEKNPHARRRLNPDQLRMLSYVVVTLVLLCSTMVELWLFYGR